MKTKPGVLVPMSAALGVAFVVAVSVLAISGANAHGTDRALAATARLSFLLFWLAYTGSALATLFGPRFQPVKDRGREFGLCFASAHLVHLGLVGWICWIGAAPGVSTFLFFGIAVVFTYLIAAFSVPSLYRALDRRLWWLLLTVGLNYIMYAFATDFFRRPGAGPGYYIGYLPFAVLCIVGPTLRLAAFGLRLFQTQRASLPAG
jgi:hypothetical protein